MKKRIKQSLLGLLIGLTACNSSPEYRYQDLPQVVTCNEMPQDFMHELMYSFREDIGIYYNQYSDYIEGTTGYYFEAFGNYVYFGFAGTARFDDIASEHSRELLKELRTYKDFWVVKNDQQRLNYAHPYLMCLIDGVKNDNLRVSLQNLRKANSLSPELIAETMRINFQEILGDPNLAMYLALDGFYQPLINRSAKR